MKALYKKKEEILNRVEKGEISQIKAEQLLKSIDDKLNSKTVLK